MTEALEASRPALTHVPLSAAPLPPLDSTSAPWPGDYLDIDGHTVHVRRTPGPADSTAVYVHGLGGSATNWTDLAGQLSGHVDGHALDLPGFGRSEPIPGYTFSMATHAEVVVAYIESLGVGPVHLFGNSMGGAISLIAAAARPDLVRTLTLISPAVPDLRPSLRRVSDPRLPLAFLPVLGSRMRRQLALVTPEQRTQQMLRLCFADPSQVPEVRIEQSAAEYAERTAQPWSGTALGRSTVELIRTWLVPRSRSMWLLPPRITAPSLVVWGTEDRLVSARKAPRVARLLPRGRLLVLPRTGHVAQMERPESVARAVLGMWESGAAW
ncbi:alpha/beta fold hydrolase [Actinosynnema sp. NPDC047251]|uniref:Alpha/beta hydrolase fold containing protein n=1 Tax=Saccharothrix espanaensis (strain ATCC 51144 / DSM 44229 / JCM 9112 / NBRC 15066 / NRRL 15764) TaxID=1179773 RepID=K0JR61_SACES|nr:alpha/beta fold hydrolase [Saccharothrix espanaensis]CCH28256.1 alpha/beta hydrolase fold containing protein [Saccharothrix espanaensis DSM 44229]